MAAALYHSRPFLPLPALNQIKNKSWLSRKHRITATGGYSTRKVSYDALKEVDSFEQMSHSDVYDFCFWCGDS